MTSAVSVSVVIPLFNKGAYITAAIQSVLAQGHRAFEILVVDDGSTDDGPSRVRALSDPRITLVTQANGGVSAARNRGIAMATGELVAFLDADDVHHREYLATLAQLWLTFPGAGLYCTGYRRTDAAGHHLDVMHPGLARGAMGLIGDFYGDWSRQSFTCTISIAVRRSLLASQACPFPVGEPLGEDQDLWFRLAEQAPVAFCNSPLADYRVDIAGSASKAHEGTDVLPCYRRLAERLDTNAVPPRMRAGARRLLASHLINTARARARLGDAAAAMELLGNPRSRGNLVYWLRSLAWVAGSRLGLVAAR